VPDGWVSWSGFVGVSVKEVNVVATWRSEAVTREGEGGCRLRSVAKWALGREDGGGLEGAAACAWQGAGKVWVGQRVVGVVVWIGWEGGVGVDVDVGYGGARRRSWLGACLRGD